MKKKQIAIILLSISVVGFVFAQTQKKKYRVFEERIFNNNPYSKKINAQTGNEYLFSLWAVDEETGIQQWADMEFYFKIETQSGELVEEKTLVASKSEEEGGIRRAQNGDDLRYIPKRSEDLIFTATLKKGDYFDIEVYENLPKTDYWLPVLFIAIFIAGIILYVRAWGSVNVQGKTIQNKKKKNQNKK